MGILIATAVGIVFGLMGTLFLTIGFGVIKLVPQSLISHRGMAGWPGEVVLTGAVASIIGIVALLAAIVGMLLPWQLSLTSGVLAILAVYVTGRSFFPAELSKLRFPLVLYTATSFAGAFVSALS